MLEPLVLILIGYLLGSIPLGYLLVQRLRGVDLKTQGSGNIGAANAYRTAGLRHAIGVLALDIAKGAAPVLLARPLVAGDATPAAAGVAAILGHVFPVWLGFRGGKGVATACGVFSVLAPLATAISGVFFVLTVWLTRYISLGSLVASAALAPVAFALGVSPAVVLAAALSALVIVQRHRSNLVRLQAGTERRLGQKA
jgi:glycerol-3-phosphate acyltransferase PlsY